VTVVDDGGAVGIAPAHVVHFYDRAADVVARVAAFAVEGIRRDEAVVVVATPPHRRALAAALTRDGIDVQQAEALGRYLALNAADTLATFMDGIHPDADRFSTTVGGLIDRAGQGGRPVRVFGEMVALLWESGDAAAAIRLESLWNDLARTRPFTLLCAYPISALAEHRDLTAISAVCDLHAGVLAPRSYAVDVEGTDDHEAVTERSQVFVPVPSAVRAVRRFVIGTLRAWGEHALLPDAALVVSELATNAVTHAASPFRASVSRSGGAVRIAIEDVGLAHPRLLPADPERTGGRGVSLVDDLSTRWGHDDLPTGKVVWSELIASRSTLAN
jgi:anti-sigma regulatory factor (Ser/Thr protein kinase)